jgi:hypothetical protein
MLNADYSWFNRRHFLKHMAGFGAMALPGMQFVQALRAKAPEMKKNGKSLIVLWMSGGPPSIDIWDLKPGQVTGGEFKTIKTSAPGIEICEHMPTVAKQMQHLSLVRSLVTNEGDHARGRILMHTSRVPSPTPFTVQNPGQPPDNIRLPETMGQGLEQAERIKRRHDFFQTVEENFKNGKRGEAAKSHQDIYKKAFDLVASPLGKVFDLNTEKKSLVDEYGNNGFGKGCLLARKLVEAGVTCVEVDLGGWDLHQGIFPSLKNQRLPTLDKGMGTLIKDLVARGLYKNTVVVWMGEFGRTPRINANAGRDHWARCWAVAIGGGAIKGGQVFGATDEEGMSVKGDATATVGDLFATVYKGLGMDPALQIRDNLGRPMPISEGKPISQLV